MTSTSTERKTGTITASGFGGVNMLKFIHGALPANIWPARIRLLGIGDNGRAAAKLHYVDVDGTDPRAVSDLLAQSTEISLSEIDCEIDLIGLLSELESLDVIMPNTAVRSSASTVCMTCGTVGTKLR